MTFYKYIHAGQHEIIITLQYSVYSLEPILYKILCLISPCDPMQNIFKFAKKAPVCNINKINVKTFLYTFLTLTVGNRALNSMNCTLSFMNSFNALQQQSLKTGAYEISENTVLNLASNVFHIIYCDGYSLSGSSTTIVKFLYSLKVCIFHQAQKKTYYNISTRNLSVHVHADVHVHIHVQVTQCAKSQFQG